MSETFRQRGRRHSRQFVEFALVGGSGVLVNQVTLVAVTKAARGWARIDRNTSIFSIGDRHVRWYLVFLTVAFLVANLWNFVLNRCWTFRHARHRRWWHEYAMFLLAGLASLIVGLGISTALITPGSPVALPRHIFDDSSGLRDRLYWANLIQIALTLPINFIVNKLWTFRARHTPGMELPMVAPVVDPEADQARENG